MSATVVLSSARIALPPGEEGTMTIVLCSDGFSEGLPLVVTFPPCDHEILQVTNRGTLLLNQPVYRPAGSGSVATEVRENYEVALVSARSDVAQRQERDLLRGMIAVIATGDLRYLPSDRSRQDMEQEAREMAGPEPTIPRWYVRLGSDVVVTVRNLGSVPAMFSTSIQVATSSYEGFDAPPRRA